MSKTLVFKLELASFIKGSETNSDNIVAAIV